MIYVAATIELKSEEVRGEFLKIFKANVPAVKAEKGCMMYEPTLDLASGLPAQRRVSKSVVTIVEGWESMAHLSEHLKAPHMASYREKVKDMVKSVALNVLEPA